MTRQREGAMSWYSWEETDEKTGETYYCADWGKTGSPYRFKTAEERNDFFAKQRAWEADFWGTGTATWDETDEKTGEKYYCVRWGYSGSPLCFKTEKELDEFISKQYRR